MPAERPSPGLWDRIAESVGFHAFSDPEVFWLNSPEYLNHFRLLTGDTSMTEAAWTDTRTPHVPMPPYINVQASPAVGDNADSMILTVRGSVHPETGDSPTVLVEIPVADWDELIAQAQRVRQTLG